ncbi:tetraspanin-33-like [Acropora muricata]|uniref:tetraspanin-33-like n=1 Tax=Acropora millepora TaxID=45264 RepID=UPI001CF57E97|nr:tetraspanin-33-like [Acropora millepora]
MYLKDKFSFHCVVKYFLFSTNTLLWIISTIFIGVGSWAYDDKRKYSDLDSLAFDPSVLIIIVGCLMFVITFCGCVGALRENKILLKVFVGTLTIIFILELVTGFVAFFFVDKTQSKVKDATHNVIIRYRDDPDLQNAIDKIQQGLKCCGGYSYHDWEHNEHFNCSAKTVQACGVPFSCCRKDQINTHCGFSVRKEKLETEASSVIYTQGCIDSLTFWINDHLHIVGGLAFGFALIQLLGILGAFNMIRDIDFILKSHDTDTDINYIL